MKQLKFFKVIGYIDDDLVEEAAGYSARSGLRWLRYGALAACFVLIVAAAFMLPRMLGGSGFAAPSAALSAVPAASAQPDVQASMDVETISVTATQYQGAYIASDTGFVVRGEGLTEELVKQSINITPDVDFTVQAASDGSYLVTPEADISSNALVNVEFLDDAGNPVKKWAFQTGDVFRVIGTYPAEGDYVDITSGIEISFNVEDLNLQSIEEAFSITPETGGRFEQHGKTVAYVPDEPLVYGIEYTVTLKKTASDSLGNALQQDETFTFYTNAYTVPDGCFNSAQYELDSFTPGDGPIIELNVGEDYRSEKIKTEVYAYSSFDAFANALLASRGDSAPNTVGMTQVAAFTADQMPSPSGNTSYSYVVYPDGLAEGMYLAVYTITAADGNDYTLYRFMQVSQLSVYAATADNQMLLWLNDASANEPLEGADITLTNGDGTVSGISGEDGTAILDLPGDGPYLTKITAGGRYFAMVCNQGWGSSGEISPDYYGYLYTSREMYLTSDTVRLWGYVLPRKSAAAQPEAVTVSFGDIQELTVPVEENGSFQCELSYEDLAPSSVYTTVTVDGALVYGKYVTVNDYEKPVYVLNLSTDKEIYGPDEVGSVQVIAETTFFDGTPVPDMPLKYTTDMDYEGQSVTADENGRASFTVSYDKGYRNYWDPFSANISVNTNENDSVDTYGYISPVLFFHDIMLEGSLETDDGQTTLAIGSHYIDLAGIGTQEDLYTDDYPANIRGGAYDATVTVHIVEQYYEQTVTGSYYDFIYKKTVETYDSVWVENDLGTYVVPVTGGEAVFDGLPEMKDDRSYTITLTTTDSEGYTVQSEVYRYTDFGYGYFGAGDSGSLSLSFQSDTGTFGAGEDAELQIRNYFGAFEAGEGSYFIAFCRQDSFYNAKLSEGSGFLLDYSDENVPNVTVAGAYYDNGRVYDIAQCYLIFDPAQWTLQVDIMPEKTQYEPGDETAVTVKVTDGNGMPVTGAALCVSVSDEAAFAVEEQEVDFPAELYAYRYWGDFNTYVSYHQNDRYPDMMAEMGGEGVGTYRKEFVDDITLTNVTTDEKGEVTVDFKLADNLTSWRVTALAAAGGEVGNAKTNISTALPVFVQPTFTDAFVEGDDISFGCRTYGTAVSGGDMVDYEAIVTDAGGGVVATLDVEYPAGENASFNFGKLPMGEYVLMLSGETDVGSDGVQLSFKVADTTAELWFTGQKDIDDLDALNPTKYPVILSFSNGAYEVYNGVLNTLYATGEVRTDETAARRMALEALAELTGDGSYLEDLPDMTELKQKYDLVSELPAGTGTAYFTARMAAAAPEDLNEAYLTEAFRDILDNYNASTEEVTSAYMGLAAFGEPVLAELRSFADENKDLLSDTDLLRISAAFALMGDYDRAEGIYDQYVTPRLAWLEVDSDESYLRYDLGGKEEDNVERTALASTIASVLNGSDADDLAEYLIYAKQALSGSADAWFYPLPELMTYLRFFVPEAGEAAVISYNKDGRQVTQTLEKRGITTVVFNTAGEYQNADIRVISGQPSVVAAWRGSLSEAQGQRSDYLSVDKTIDGGAGLGQTATVTITVTAKKDGWVCIEDYIPSGFRLADNPSYVDGRTVRFWQEVQGGTVTVRYKIKPVVEGSFVVESPVAARLDNGLLVTGERSVIEVTK